MTDSRRLLVISSFPPRRCGIGSYAAAQVRWLSDHGASVETLGLGSDCDADRQVDLQRTASILRCIATLKPRRFDQVLFNYTDGFLRLPAGAWPRQVLVVGMQALFLLALALFSGRRLRVIAHEITYRPHRGRLWELVRRRFMAMVGEVQFHTEAERQRAIDYLAGGLRAERTRIVAHDRYMTSYFAGTRADARRELGLEQDRCLFLCIGFLAPHKGFERAVRAIDRLPPGRDAALYLVTSLRATRPEVVAYRDQLAATVARSPRSALIEDFPDDRRFDAWLRAADAVVLPYLSIWSSGVGARARLLGTALVASALPNLAAQFAGDDQVSLFHDEDQLVAILDRLAQRTAACGPARDPGSNP